MADLFSQEASYATSPSRPASGPFNPLGQRSLIAYQDLVPSSWLALVRQELPEKKFPKKLDKTYDTGTIEPKIAQKWDEADALRAGANARPGAETFTIVIPLPNVTGSC